MDYDIKVSDSGKITCHEWNKEGYQLMMIAQADVQPVFTITSPLATVKMTIDNFDDERKIDIWLATTDDDSEAAKRVEEGMTAIRIMNVFQDIVDSLNQPHKQAPEKETPEMAPQPNYSTNDHKIQAWYYYQTDGQVTNAQPVDVNGDNLQEISDDLIKFFNESEETAEKFTVYSEYLEDGYAQVKLVGRFYEEDGEGGYTNETTHVTVIIEANKKN